MRINSDMKKKIKAIIFDLDDTLYPEKSFRNSGFDFISQKLRKNGCNIKSSAIEDIYERHPKDCFDKLIAKYNLPFKPPTLIDWYRNHIPKISPYPQAITLLKKLKKNYLLGILTDYYYRVQFRKIKSLGIKKFFNIILYTDRINAEKPSTLGFRLIKKRLRCGTGEIVYVGDNEVKDFLGAKRAGFLTVKFCNKDGFHSHKKMPKTHKAHYEIHNIADLTHILDNINL